MNSDNPLLNRPPNPNLDVTIYKGRERPQHTLRRYGFRRESPAATPAFNDLIDVLTDPNLEVVRTNTPRPSPLSRIFSRIFRRKQ